MPRSLACRGPISMLRSRASHSGISGVPLHTNSVFTQTYLARLTCHPPPSSCCALLLIVAACSGWFSGASHRLQVHRSTARVIEHTSRAAQSRVRALQRRRCRVSAIEMQVVKCYKSHRISGYSHTLVCTRSTARVCLGGSYSSSMPRPDEWSCCLHLRV